MHCALAQQNPLPPRLLDRKADAAALADLTELAVATLAAPKPGRLGVTDSLEQVVIDYGDDERFEIEVDQIAAPPAAHLIARLFSLACK